MLNVHAGAAPTSPLDVRHYTASCDMSHEQETSVSVHGRTSGSTHTAAVGAGIGRKASQPLHTAMDRNCLLHCLLLVNSLHRVTMFPKCCLPACYSLNCSWCVGTLRVPTH